MKVVIKMRNSCRHFNGPIHNEHCKAGVNYRKLGDDSRPGVYARLPCVIGSPLTKPDAATCELISPYTLEELAAKEAEIIKNSNDTLAAIKLIKATKLQTGHVECPVCKANLQFSVSPSNGHIWAKCSTQGCLAWMM